MKNTTIFTQSLIEVTNNLKNFFYQEDFPISIQVLVDSAKFLTGKIEIRETATDTQIELFEYQISNNGEIQCEECIGEINQSRTYYFSHDNLLYLIGKSTNKKIVDCFVRDNLFHFIVESSLNDLWVNLTTSILEECIIPNCNLENVEANILDNAIQSTISRITSSYAIQEIDSEVCSLIQDEFSKQIQDFE